jgi:large subunit ribosomal protein L22
MAGQNNSTEQVQGLDEASAYLKQTRLSPRKARLVADQIRGKPVGEAINLLRFSTKKAAFILLKLLNSAIANAEHNKDIDPDSLYVGQIFVDQGPTLKRLKIRARGRADQMRKPTSNLRVIVKRTREAG